jgi:uncharacterized protein (DUF736 family)
LVYAQLPSKSRSKRRESARARPAQGLITRMGQEIQAAWRRVESEKGAECLRE